MSAFSLPPPPRPSFTPIPECFVVHYYISAYNYHCIFLPIYPYMRPTYYKIGYQGETKYYKVEIHAQLSHNGHPVDGAPVGVGSLWPGE